MFEPHIVWTHMGCLSKRQKKTVQLAVSFAERLDFPSYSDSALDVLEMTLEFEA
jgi:hypothetical protein